jgi:hypothetical protein
VPDERETPSSNGAFSILDDPPPTTSNKVTVASQLTAGTTTGTAEEQTSGLNRHGKHVGAIIGGVLVGGLGFGVLVGGLVLYIRRRRLMKTDAERSPKPYVILDGGEEPPRVGMVEASFARARYGGVEPFVRPLRGQTPTIPPMEKGVLGGDSTASRQSSREPGPVGRPGLMPSKSRSPTRTPNPNLTITVPHSNNKRAQKWSALESTIVPKTALPPYPGSPLANQ